MSQKGIAALTGSLLTFLGISTVRLRAWTAALTDTLSVLRFPELHLDLALFRGLASWGWSVLLVAGAVGTGVVLHPFWSEPLIRPVGTMILDDSDAVVESGRAYVADLKSGRLRLVCAGGYSANAAAPPTLAVLRPGGTIEDVLVTVRFERGIAELKEAMSVVLTGRQWASGAEIDGIPSQAVRQVLCSPAINGRHEISEGILAELQQEVPGKEGVVLRLSDRWLADPDAIIQSLDSFRGRFIGQDVQSIFLKRTETLNRIENSIREYLGETGFLSTDAVKVSFAYFFGQFATGDKRKKAVERAILLRGLMRATVERRDRELLREEIIEIGKLIGPLIGENGHEASRTLIELLLEVQHQHPTAVGSSFHELILDRLPVGSEGNRNPEILGYLTVAANLGALGDPQSSFLKDRLSHLRTWAGPGKRLTEHVVATERGRGDPAMSLEQIEKVLDQAERRVELSQRAST